MRSHSELHLVVPGICGPLAETQSLKSSPVIDRWLATLARSSQQASAKTFESVIAEILDLEIEGDFPSAALTLLADASYDPARFYMHADPVHLQADMDHAILTSSADLDISDEQANTLCETLNRHFKSDGLTFLKQNKDQWFVESENDIDMQTTSLVEATGRNINFLLPQGAGSARWKQLMTEAQMLLHAHECNENREGKGQHSINSLWFHGCGNLADLDHTKVNHTMVDHICSDDEMLRGLANQLRCEHIKVPATADDYVEYLLSCEPGSRSILHLSQLEHLVNYSDVSIWLKQLDRMLQDWVYPLVKNASRNNIKVTLYPCDGKSYLFSRYDFLRFWRRAGLDKAGLGKAGLEKYISSYQSCDN